MAKQKIRAIPYRVYKKMFSDCKAYDYCNGKITVEFPDDYLQDKYIVPEGWNKGSNYCNKMIGKDKCGNGFEVWAEISFYSDGGCKYYDAYVTVGNTFTPFGRRYSKEFFRSFNSALQWALETASKEVK